MGFSKTYYNSDFKPICKSCKPTKFNFVLGALGDPNTKLPTLGGLFKLHRWRLNPIIWGFWKKKSKKQILKKIIIIKVKRWEILSITILWCYLNSNYQFGDNHKSRDVNSVFLSLTQYLTVKKVQMNYFDQTWNRLF